MALGDQPKIPDFGNSDSATGQTGSQLKEVLSFMKTLSLFVIAAIFLRGSVVEAYKIPSGSMIPTLRIGDHILVSKLAYGIRLPFVQNVIFSFDEPKRGDVVVFTRPDDPDTMTDESDINIIKRVIGLPGDIVEVRGTQVYINNELLPEVYARWEENGTKAGYFGPERVPEDRILLLGDNRDHSRDSRFWPNHFLEISRVKGKAFLIYWSSFNLGRIGQLIR